MVTMATHLGDQSKFCTQLFFYTKLFGKMTALISFISQALKLIFHNFQISPTRKKERWRIYDVLTD